MLTTELQCGWVGFPWGHPGAPLTGKSWQPRQPRHELSPGWGEKQAYHTDKTNQRQKKKEREKGKSKEGGMLMKKNKQKNNPMHKIDSSTCWKKGFKYTLHTLQTAETLYKGQLTKIHFTSFEYTV